MKTKEWFRVRKVHHLDCLARVAAARPQDVIHVTTSTCSTSSAGGREERNSVDALSVTSQGRTKHERVLTDAQSCSQAKGFPKGSPKAEAAGCWRERNET